MTGNSTGRGLIGPILLGTLLQLVMVTAAHFLTPVTVLFPFLGTLIGGGTGLLATMGGAPGPRRAAKLGALSGGATGLLGTLAAFALGDIPAFTIGIGTGAAAGAGALGALGGRLLGHRRGA